MYECAYVFTCLCEVMCIYWIYKCMYECLCMCMCLCVPAYTLKHVHICVIKIFTALR